MFTAGFDTAPATRNGPGLGLANHRGEVRRQRQQKKIKKAKKRKKNKKKKKPTKEQNKKIKHKKSRKKSRSISRHAVIGASSTRLNTPRAVSTPRPVPPTTHRGDPTVTGRHSPALGLPRSRTKPPASRRVHRRPQRRQWRPAAVAGGSSTTRSAIGAPRNPPCPSRAAAV